MRARTTEDIRNLLDGIERVGRLSDGLIGFRKSYFRLGIDPFVNLIPVAGPLYTAGTGGYLIVQAFRAHVPFPTLAGMGMCMAADMVIGTIPFAGYVTDFVWRGQGVAARLAEQAIAETQFIEGTVQDARSRGELDKRTSLEGSEIVSSRETRRRRVFLKGTR